MKKALKLAKTVTVDDLRNDRSLISELRGDIHPELRGDIHPELRGNISELRGDISELRGDISGLRGDISGLWGDIHPELRGDIDECEITDDERAKGIDISELIDHQA